MRPVMSSGRVRYDAGHTVGGRKPSGPGRTRAGGSFQPDRSWTPAGIGTYGNCSMLPERAKQRLDSEVTSTDAKVCM
ncbi:hypothetical protein Van01_08330 [Micromonospora andamanensis]|uniref:Uncharacterized protein n=1 Tax=Micromonospora andamanensis TaxID=1287068 RepID=A0ABQ4HPQ1_9ACTN|nr:hypothetical protein Van01_08330 [Micromonospora andamanensis]